MAEIIPAVIGKNFAEVRDKISIVDGLVDWVQLDIMDGLFVPPYTWQTADDLNELGGKIKVEVHLMIENPEQEISRWLSVADRIIFHFEATNYVEEILNTFDNTNVKVGIALKMETPVTAVEPWLSRLNTVQLMSIDKIGYHGHAFAERVLDKVSALRKMWPGGTINIDGGVTLETGKRAIEAGASNLVVGSALWQAEDLAAEIEKFKLL